MALNFLFPPHSPQAGITQMCLKHIFLATTREVIQLLIKENLEIAFGPIVLYTEFEVTVREGESHRLAHSHHQWENYRTRERVGHH